mmetsp:Transcript_23375/g.78606  ORF Transcript_23375/g.78606 Transcript_23375/m.78606 type:complete len:270 (+) Transcript_23375:936-1745(+)
MHRVGLLVHGEGKHGAHPLRGVREDGRDSGRNRREAAHRCRPDPALPSASHPGNRGLDLRELRLRSDAVPRERTGPLLIGCGGRLHARCRAPHLNQHLERDADRRGRRRQAAAHHPVHKPRADQKRLAQNQHAPGSGGRELNGRLGFPPAARLHTLPQLAVNLQPLMFVHVDSVKEKDEQHPCAPDGGHHACSGRRRLVARRRLEGVFLSCDDGAVFLLGVQASTYFLQLLLKRLLGSPGVGVLGRPANIRIAHRGRELSGVFAMTGTA